MLIEALAGWLKHRGSCLPFSRLGGAPYLDRHFIHRIPGRKGTLLHKFMSSDPSDPHCHPWDSRSYLIKGEYIEDIFGECFDHNGDRLAPRLISTAHYRAPCRLPYRPAETIHRIRLIDDKPAWTVFTHKWRRRAWFFHMKAGTLRPGEPAGEPRPSYKLVGTWFPRMIGDGTKAPEEAHSG